jgi:hypothetical protein
LIPAIENESRKATRIEADRHADVLPRAFASFWQLRCSLGPRTASIAAKNIPTREMRPTKPLLAFSEQQRRVIDS